MPACGLLRLLARSGDPSDDGTGHPARRHLYRRHRALKQDAIRTRHALSDSRRAGNYFRLIDEGRIRVGGDITTRVSEPSRLAERMKRDMLSVFPQLGNRRSIMPGRAQWDTRAISCR